MPANPSPEGTLNGGRLCRAVTRARLHGTLCVSRVLGMSLPLRLCRAAHPCQNGPSRLPGQPWRGTEPCCVPLIAAWKGCGCFTPEGGHSDGHLPGSSYCKFRASNSVAVHICGRLNGDHTRPGNVLMKWGGPVVRCGYLSPPAAGSQLLECRLSWENLSLLPRGPSQGKAPPWALECPSCLRVEVRTGARPAG